MKRGDINTALQQARHHMLFDALDDEEFEQATARARLLDLDGGERLFTQGDKAERFFLVLSGSIKLFRIAFDGQEKVVHLMREGDSLAEAVMFMSQTQYPVNAEALGATRVLSFSNLAYKGCLEASSQACFRVMASMARRLHLRLDEIETLTLQNARHRFVRYLLQLLVPDATGNTGHIELPVAKRLIASRLAMQPETLSRIMHDLKEEGIVEGTTRQLQVLDVSALQEMI
ncbi:Crp/Fnr family transcriptional regulator [Marinobacterium aestuariivivens]|uniref:Crp/Fnr family transcriptional regulator n=1 Tax=Marinobacterium aestuariivivens TaxID=1698799 RepID=A0ABW1ZVM9_9GAMM